MENTYGKKKSLSSQLFYFEVARQPPVKTLTRGGVSPEGSSEEVSASSSLTPLVRIPFLKDGWAEGLACSRTVGSTPPSITCHVAFLLLCVRAYKRQSLLVKPESPSFVPSHRSGMLSKVRYSIRSKLAQWWGSKRF